MIFLSRSFNKPDVGFSERPKHASRQQFISENVLLCARQRPLISSESTRRYGRIRVSVRESTNGRCTTPTELRRRTKPGQLWAFDTASQIVENRLHPCRGGAM